MNRAAATFTTLAGIAAAYYLVLGRAHFADIAACNREVSEAYARFEAAEQETARELLLQRGAAQVEQWRQQLLPMLTLPAAGPPPLVAASEALAADGLRVERAESLTADPALGHANARLRLAVAGPFPAFFTALRNLENSMPPTRVTELVLVATAIPGEVRGEMIVVRTWSEAR